MDQGKIRLDTLRLNETNPRKITDDALSKLCDSIERDPQFMELRPIIIDENRIIIGGNQRYKAIQQIGMEEIPSTWVKMAKDLTPDQRKRFIVVDNSPDGMAGYWDFDLLKIDWTMPELEDIGFLFKADVDLSKEWEGMPEFVSEDKSGLKIIVHFETEDAIRAFGELIGQSLTNKTKSIWYPERERDVVSDIAWTDEGDEDNEESGLEPE